MKLIIRLIHLCKFYLVYVILGPVAYLFNHSFLNYHPDFLLPYVITPARNHDIRTFPISTSEVERIRQLRLSLIHPSDRYWRHPENVGDSVRADSVLTSVVTLETSPSVRLLDGPLAQGVAFLQDDQYLYLWEEFGRWPTRHDLIVTLAYSWNLDRFLYLFIPTNLFPSEPDVEQEWFEPRWRSMKTLRQVIEDQAWARIFVAPNSSVRNQKWCLTFSQ